MKSKNENIVQPNFTSLAGAEGRVAKMAEGLIGSDILKVAYEIRALINSGKKVCNLTVGDFDPTQFRIPKYLEEKIKEAYTKGETNYPPSSGVPVLRDSIRRFYKEWFGLEYPDESICVTSGSRPAIFATYRALLDPEDTVVYPVPSWNNSHYCHLNRGKGIPIEISSDDSFLPTRKKLENAVRGARLLALNSPLNPTGTMYTAETLGEICDLVLEENVRRSAGERPLYVMYDQVYWMLTFGSNVHVNPVSIRPEMAKYTILVDGISKAFAATGVRVGWTLGPPDVIKKMTIILAHVGTWAPRAEQVATAQLLDATNEIEAYRASLKASVMVRLDALYAGISDLKKEGFPVDAINPMGAIYLSSQFRLYGKKTPEGKTLTTNEDIRKYLLDAAGFGVVPFQAFDAMEEDGWFRLSVGAVSLDDIETMLPRLKAALQGLKD